MEGSADGLQSKQQYLQICHLTAIREEVSKWKWSFVQNNWEIFQSQLKDRFDNLCKIYILKNAEYFGVGRQKNYVQIFLTSFLSDS